MPLKDIIAKIMENSKLSEDEINAKIKEKTEKLSGLISQEGAAHILANELGIKLFDIAGKIKIKGILTGMRSVEFSGKVMQVFNVSEFKKKDGTPGKVGSFVLGDETGTIRVAAWGSHADSVKEIKEGGIIKIKSGYVRDNRGRKEVHLNDRSEIIMNPEGESISEVKEKEDEIRKPIKDLAERDQNVTLLGTIVQVFEPRFFEVCPECGKRARFKDDAFNCDEHNKVEPEFSYVMNVVLDDGSDNIRVVCFKNQLESLIGKDKNGVLIYRQDPSKFDSVKNELLGQIVKFNGRVNKNEMFDRLEFVASRVYTDLDPEEEIKRLDEEVKKVNK